MATYPAGNPGVIPVDATTPVGSLRYAIGDTAYELYTPDVPPYANFAAFSDAELEALLVMGGGIPANAIGYAYLKLAGQAAGQAVAWASDDLRLSLEKTPTELRLIAAMWFEQGEAATLAAEDHFDIVPTGGHCHPCEYFPGESSFRW